MTPDERRQLERDRRTLARHSSVTLTFGRYTKTDDQRKRAAVESIGQPPNERIRGAV